MAYEKTYANGYTFAVDQTTGTIVATGKLQTAMAERNQAIMAKTGGEMKKETDHAGHVISARENGPSITENLAAQDSKLNLSTYKKVENAEYRLLQEGCEIQTEKIAYMSNPKTEQGVRPDCFMVNDQIAFSDGQTQGVHLSFSNLTYGQQESINQELMSTVSLNNDLNVGDVLREEMSPQEYAQLMEETDSLLPDIREEFEEQVFINRSDVEEEVSVQEDWNFEMEQAVESEVEAVSDWSFDAESDNSMDVGDSISAETDCSADTGSIDCGSDCSADAL